MNFLVPDSLPSELQQKARDRELVPGQVLFHYQDTARYVFALKEGRIRMLRYTCEGNLVIFKSLGREKVLPNQLFLQRPINVML